MLLQLVQCLLVGIHLNMPLSEAACSRAFLRREAILVPRHMSPDPSEDTAHDRSPAVATVIFDGEELIGNCEVVAVTPPKVGWYMDCMEPLPVTADRDPPMADCPNPPAPEELCGKDCASPCRGNVGGSVRAEGAPPICEAIPGIGGQPRESFPWKLHKESPIAGGNCGKPCEGSNAPGVRNTLVVFLRFFHLARRFWNHTCR